MPRSFPDSTTLLKAAIKYLEEELMPTLDTYHRFKTRVTANVLSTIKRELELRETQAAAEHVRLVELLGHDGDVEALSTELAERIRTGAIPLDKPGLRDHLKQSLHDALSISNPKWLTR
jgi:uncharacterized protein DUF6285